MAQRQALRFPPRHELTGRAAARGRRHAVFELIVGGAGDRFQPVLVLRAAERRRLHPAPVEFAGQKEMVWDDIRTAPRDHMQMSFQHRRHGIVGDCRQMKIDVDSYNDAHEKEEQIEIVFNFEMDLAELEAAD